MPLRVLPTMSMRTFRLKVAKSFALPKSEQPSMRLWLKMPNESYAFLEEAQDTQDLSWLGFENDSEILLYTSV
jgi:tubulin-specific chaperone E